MRESHVHTSNRQLYESPDAVAEYAAIEGLSAAEQTLIDRYVTPGAAVLDIGIGAGRTTAHLLPLSAHYIGIDYSTAMVSTAKSHFPDADLRVLDASDLSSLEASSFDVVVFSFNGLDCLHPVDCRRACIAEMARVLRPGGVVVLSSHNARALVRPRRDAGTGLRGVARSRLTQLSRSVRLTSTAVRSGVLFRGEGYMRDPGKPSTLYTTTPRRAAAQFADHGLALDATLGNLYPLSRPAFMHAWYYYAFIKKLQGGAD